MVSPSRPLAETRYDQIFPKLEAVEIERLRRFGELRSYGAEHRLVRAGDASQGLFVILSGDVAITQHSPLGRDEQIVTHGPGSLMGELADLSGRPALFDARALKPVEALVIPSRRLHDVLIGEDDLGERIMRALILRRMNLLQSGIAGPVVVGRADNPEVLRLVHFLARNGHPHQSLDPDSDTCGKVLIERFNLAPTELPVVLCPNGSVLRRPSDAELAECLGLVQPIDPSRLYDVTIVGAGPAGLAAAVYAASEGLSVLVLDTRAFGGQAGESARIENYLGFPTGITGMALMGRAFVQAQKFRAEVAIPDEVTSLSVVEAPEGRVCEVGLANGQRARSRVVVLASGARYRRLDVPRLAELEASGVHYWASPLEAKLCAGQEVAVVGAGNSAGQAIVYLATQTRKVWVLVRGEKLEKSMSAYLVERISGLSNVEVLLETEVVGLEGKDGTLEAVRWRHKRSGEELERPIRHLFSFIGADPNTAWLQGSGIALDTKGFVKTGADLAPSWRPLQTNLDGVFAIGDVRCGSTKRVAAAVGEGAQVVAAIHARAEGR